MTDTPPEFAEDVRKYAAEEAALAKGMEEPSAAGTTIRRIARQGEVQRNQKSKEFVEKIAEIFKEA